MRKWNHRGQMTFTTNFGSKIRIEPGPCASKSGWEMKKCKE